jgi:hypothetical protein
VVSFLLVFPPIIYTRSSYPHSCYMARPSHPPRLSYSNYTWRKVQITKLLVMQFSPFSRHLIPLRSKHPPQHLAVMKSYLLNTYVSNLLSIVPNQLQKCEGQLATLLCKTFPVRFSAVFNKRKAKTFILAYKGYSRGSSGKKLRGSCTANPRWDRNIGR